jgi:hypothetical protein
MWHAPWQKLHSQHCHMAKAMPIQLNSGARDLFKTKKILQGCFLIFFFLQRLKPKHEKIRGTKCIFKPI